MAGYEEQRMATVGWKAAAEEAGATVRNFSNRRCGPGAAMSKAAAVRTWPR